MPGDLEDVNDRIKCPRVHSQYLPEASDVPHYAFTTSLIKMLAVRVKGGAQNALEDIDEIMVLCRELLTLDTPRGHLTCAFEALTQAVLDNFSHGKQLQCLDEAIACVGDALKSWPGSHLLSFEHAQLLVVRFLGRQMDGDHEDAKAVLDSIRAPPNTLLHYQIPSLFSALEAAHSIVYSDPESWERAVSHCHSFLDNCCAFAELPFHPVITELLANHAKRASEHFSPPQGAQAVYSKVYSEVDRLPYSTQLGTFGDGADMVFRRQWNTVFENFTPQAGPQLVQGPGAKKVPQRSRAFLPHQDFSNERYDRHIGHQVQSKTPCDDSCH